MKLFRLTTSYNQYLQEFYLENPNLKNENYEIQYKKLMDDCFGQADFWTKAFSKIGFEVLESVANAEYQQKRWAQENNCDYDSKNWILDISEAQISKFQPDILFINDYNTFTYEFITRLREKVPKIRLVIGWCGAPYANDRVFKAYDIVLTNLNIHEENFKKMGHKCFLMKHAFDPSILSKVKLDDTKDNFTFVGSIVLGDGYHNERLNLLRYLVKKTDIKIFSDLNPNSDYNYYSIYFRKFLYKIIYKLMYYKFLKKELNNSKLISKLGLLPSHLNPFYPRDIVMRSKPGLYGLKMYNKIINSNITLNQHIDISKGSSNNMRLYEASGLGTCLLTDWSSDLNDKFEIDYEVVSYKSKEELIEKYNFLCNNPDKCREIGKKAQIRTLRENTYQQRAEWLNEIILNFT